MFTHRFTLALVAMGSCLGLASCWPGKKEDADKDPNPAPKPTGKVYVLDNPEVERPIGWTSVRVYRLTGKELATSVSRGAEKLEGILSNTESKRETIQSLAPDRRRLTVQRDTLRQVIKVDGMPPTDETSQGPLVGKYVIMERVDGTWKGSFESGEQPNAQESQKIALYAKDMTNGNAIFRKPERRIGDEWQVDASKMNKGATGMLQVRFERVEDFQGHQCAVLTGTMDIRLLSEQSTVMSEYEISGDFKTYRSLEQFVDLESNLAGTMTMTVSPEAGVSLTASGPVTIEESTEVILPAPAVSQR